MPNPIVIVSALSAIVPVMVGANRRSVLWYYVIISLASDIVGIVCKELSTPYHIVLNVFFLGEWSLISAFFIEKCINKESKNSFIIVSLGVALLFVAHTIFFSPHSNNLNGASVLHVLFILCSVVGFYRVIQEIDVLQIERSPLFAFCVGLLLYASGSFIMLPMVRYMNKIDKKLSEQLWIVGHGALNIIKNLAIAWSLSLQKRKAL